MHDDKFMVDPDEYIKKWGEPDSDELFPTRITVEEQVFGFKVVAIPMADDDGEFQSMRICAAVADLDAEFYAVKMQGTGDTCFYAIWNAQGRTMALPIHSVQALREIFPRRQFAAPWRATPC